MWKRKSILSLAHIFLCCGFAASGRCKKSLLCPW
jgi:hypothetical protein